MTPLAGFVAAVIAGWFIRDPLRAAAAVLVPFLAVLAVQTWTLASGHGDNPPSTVHGISYWVVQAIFLAFALGIATQLASWRRARSAPGDAAGASRRALQASAVLLVLTAAFVIAGRAGLASGAAPQRQLAAPVERRDRHRGLRRVPGGGQRAEHPPAAGEHEGEAGRRQPQRGRGRGPAIAAS